MKNTRTQLVLATALLLGVAVLVLFKQRHGESQAPKDSHTSPSSRAGTATAARQRPDRPDPTEADKQLAAQGALTDVSLSTFPLKEYRRVASSAVKASGAPVGEAYIHVPSAGSRIAMEPNQIGEFPVMETRIKETVGVRLQLAEIKPGTPVRVAIIDGGSFPSKNGLSQVIPAADWRGVAFEFTTSHNIGFHRILVEAQGHPARVLNFSAHDATWPPLSQSPAN